MISSTVLHRIKPLMIHAPAAPVFLTDSMFCEEIPPIAYTGKEEDGEQGDEQFEINDERSFKKMYEDISEEGLQPVLNDYLYVWSYMYHKQETL